MSNAASDVSKELPSIADELTERLNDAAGKPVSFSLFVWTEGRANYISNSNDRQEIKAALKSVIDGWDDGMPDIPAHKIT